MLVIFDSQNMRMIATSKKCFINHNILFYVIIVLKLILCPSSVGSSAKTAFKKFGDL